MLELPNFVNTIEISRHLRDIATSIRNREIVFLCGAGLSKDSEIPLFEDLLQAMLKDILQTADPGATVEDELLKLLVNKYPGEFLAASFESRRGRDGLAKFLREKLEPNGAIPNDGHRDLAWFASQNFIDRVYTTNLESLIKKAIGDRAEMITESESGKLRDAMSKGKIPIIHLHGCLVDNNFRITERDLYVLEYPLLSVLEADLSWRILVLIGYSMNDPDLRSMYIRMLQILKRWQSNKWTYVVMPFEDEREWYVAKEAWKSRNAVLIPMTATAFLKALKATVESWDQQDRMDKASNAWSITPAELRERAKQLQEKYFNFSEKDAIEFLCELAT